MALTGLTSGGLTGQDDELHPPRPGEASWAETAWFAAAVPERGLVLWLYPLFRTTLGVMSCSVYAWGPGATELWQQPYYRQYWHVPIPSGFTLSDFTLDTGLSYRCEAPLRQYHLHYADASEPEALRFEATWTAVQSPQPVGVTGDYGHLDQLGRVTGELVLGGEHIAVDCVEMRDRTWSPRRESRQNTWLGYSYGARLDGENSDGGGLTAFHCCVRRVDDGTQQLLTGFRAASGQTVALTQAQRRVTRDDRGQPVIVEITASGVDGNPFTARGEVVSQLALHTSPYFVWVSLVRWTLPDGSTAWGEDQDTWSPGLLRAARTAGLASAGRADAGLSGAGA
jgi:hypothetical protein